MGEDVVTPASILLVCLPEEASSTCQFELATQKAASIVVHLFKSIESGPVFKNISH